MEYIRIDRNVKSKIDSIEELEKNEKYLSMIFLNKILYSYNYTVKQKENNENIEKIYVSKSIENIQDNIFGKREIVYKCIRALESYGLIERGTSYLKDEYSKGFKPLISISNKFTTVKALDYLNTKQFNNLRRREEKAKTKEIEWHLDNLKRDLEVSLLLLSGFISRFFGYRITTFKDREDYIRQVMDIEIKIDIIKAELLEEQKEINDVNIKKLTDKKAFYKMKILELLDMKDSKIVKGEKGGRHYHALSNTPSALKACMVSSNPKKPYLLQIDIKNSQPFFLLCLIEKAKIKIEESIRLAIIGGKFYERIGEAWGYSQFDIMESPRIRKEVKSLVFKHLFFCKSNAERINNPKFKEIKMLYPLFAGAVEKIANVKERTLASLLQEIETKEVIPIVKKFKAVGIHDAVVIIAVDTTEQVQKVKNELLGRFNKKFGITPELSIELISERKDFNLQLFNY